MEQPPPFLTGAFFGLIWCALHFRVTRSLLSLASGETQLVRRRRVASPPRPRSASAPGAGIDQVPDPNWTWVVVALAFQPVEAEKENAETSDEAITK